jgi:hypothetical protein
MTFTPTSIEKEGLAKYLDRTKAQHNNLAYIDFVDMIDSEMHYTKKQIGLAFGVSRLTIDKWAKIYKKETNA